VRSDDNDCIHYLDRLKEMIKVKGLQVAATEVEDVLLAHPEKLVRDACVAGVAGVDSDGGELRVRAWVVVTPAGQSAGENTVASKLETWVRERLSRHKWLTGGVEVVNEVCCARLLLNYCATELTMTRTRSRGRRRARCCGARCAIGIMRVSRRRRGGRSFRYVGAWEGWCGKG
jgi:acyl-CoA synthetase (AMP-forming)/AMP-acid ligase II